MRNHIILISVSILLFCSHGLAAPELLLPEDDARFGDENTILVLEWEDTGAAGYEFELAVDEEFELGTGPLDAEDTPFFNINDWLGDELWFSLSLSLFWRVREVSSSNVPGEWSDHRLFHKSTMGPAMVTRGGDGRYSPSTDMPLLRWVEVVPEEQDPVMDSYQLEFATDKNFTSVLGRIDLVNPELDFSGVDRTSWDLLEGIFYWRSAGVTIDGVPGPWTDICRLSKTLIDAPVVTGPDDGAVYPPISTQPVLTWNSLGTLEEYDIGIFADPLGEHLIALPHFGSTSYSFKTDLGIPDQAWYEAPFTLYWGIAGVDAEGRPGPFSTPREMIKPGLHVVVGYGDSITEGNMEGNEDNPCYTPSYYNQLNALLDPIWDNPDPVLINKAVGGMKSKWGADNARSTIIATSPQYILVMFGINDIVDSGNCYPPHECHVVDHLVEIATIAQSRGTIPIISTILPVHPEGRFAAEQITVDETNDELRDMTDQMGINLVDINAMFWAHGNLPELFCDWGHPSEAGYQIMANGYFEGIMNAGS